MENTNTQNEEPEKVEGEPFEPHKNTGMAVVAYLLFFVPLLTDAKNDPFVKFHVKQGLLVFITFVIASVLYVSPLMIFGMLIQIGAFILLILGILNAVHGKEEKLPVVGDFADKFKF